MSGTSTLVKPISITTKSVSTIPRILVVDDDKTLLRRIERYAKKHHLSVVTCASLRESYQVSTKVSVDVALVDFYLDEFDGTDLAEALPEVPLVVMSTYPMGCIEEETHWPKSVKKFVNKRLRIPTLFRSVLDVYGSKT